MANSIFEGFEAVEELDGNNAVQLVYGVNVLRIEAEVKAAPVGTVGQLVEAYRQQLGLPANVVVFVDGVKLEPSATIPADARRIDVVKPAGEKGVCEGTPIIPLAEGDAVGLEVYAYDLTTVWQTLVEELGVMDDSLLEVIPLPEGVEVVAAEQDGRVVIGRSHKVRVASHTTLRQLAVARRRLPLTLNDLGFDPIRTLINGKEVGECVDLAAGWEVCLVVEGNPVAVDLEDWTCRMQAQAEAAYREAIEAQAWAINARMTELEALGFFAIRAAGKEAGVPVAGLGRTKAAIINDILDREFPTRNEEEWTREWLLEHAPEVLENDLGEEDEV